MRLRDSICHPTLSQKFEGTFRGQVKDLGMGGKIKNRDPITDSTAVYCRQQKLFPAQPKGLKVKRCAGPGKQVERVLPCRSSVRPLMHT